MQNVNNSPFCLYRYDPLNRLCDCILLGQESARRFYQKDRLATEISGAVQHSIMQHADQLLAQQQRQTDTVETSLLATDQQRSVLNVLTASTPQPITHTPYGHRPLASGLLSLLGFNGERPDPVTGHYLLGNGYRAFNPVLMRFNSPDSWSPFGKGGMNAYAYCSGDPRNRRDSTGHFSIFPKGYNPIKALQNRLRLRTPSGRNELQGTGSALPGSRVSSTAGASSEQKTRNKTIASQQNTIELQQRTIETQQRTIETQQKTITSQQRNIDSAETTIARGRVVVRDYQKMLNQQTIIIEQQQILITDLKEDLSFSLYMNPNSNRTPADVLREYGSHSPSPPIGNPQLNNSQSENTAIRNS
ncbi:MAG: RHS repeat-associated core domain-containing protein [Pseudomonadales bacterium]|nr:RHS repeat-associated core domain-containing protein [Pseudomonadales bacterium]MBH2079051.1 RHS repeat-associated core domain-containing protein [Pseudomonadales bacterium]